MCPPSPPSASKLQSLITSNLFIHIPSSSSSSSSSSPNSPNSHSRVQDENLIFFIPGNPGLISYYHTFLSLLSDRDSSAATSRCIVVGFSLGGFEISDPSTTEEDLGDDRGVFERLGKGPMKKEEEEEERGGKGLYSLREQIGLTASRLNEVVRQLQGSGEDEEEDGGGGTGRRRKWKVTLIGHSVGAYIALEVLSLHRRRQKQSSSPSTSTSVDIVDHETEVGPAFDISAAILLTPTIIDIAASSSGRILAPLLNYIPAFPLLVSWGAKLISALLPGRWVKRLVGVVMGRDAPDGAVETTVNFLGSKGGVRQSLEMAADEMREIGGDGWGGEVWGVVDEVGGKAGGQGFEPVELVFYFARKDHWVANTTREAVISARGGKGEGGRTKMVVAEDGELVHGWCIGQSGSVARKVDEWVGEIMKRR